MQFLVSLVLAGFVGQVSAPKVVISKSQKLKPGVVNITTPENLNTPAVLIRGNNLTLDFTGVEYRGTPLNTEPDQRKGLGVRIEGKNITIKNLKVRGYKVGVWAEKCQGLKLINCDFSYNWKQKLLSTPEKEDLADWMSFHNNEQDQWLQYGAGAYFKEVNGFEVRNLTITGGQCGLMLNRSNKGLVWNSNLSYLSGVGLGLYRSSENRVMHNNIDYCVRGYSHGVYQRGQDSAGILIYEQSNKNTFAYNSVTHSGDGFFLWAGQSTMDTGKGGCNDNIVYGNDFSFAPTNGIEATFSRNKFVNNRMKECWHGFWTGYSYDTLMSANHISACEVGIAHEHGQNNTVDGNVFAGNLTDIQIWANATQDPNWGYPKTRDTRSTRWKIVGNDFYSGKKALSVKKTEGLIFERNTTFGSQFEVSPDSTDIRLLENCLHSGKADGGVPGNVKSEKNRVEELPLKMQIPMWDPRDVDDVYPESPAMLKGGKWPFLKPDQGGRKTIMVDEWGPYTGQHPKLVDTGIVQDGQKKLSILGPKGKFTVVLAKGLTTSSQSGAVPGSIWVKDEPTSPSKILRLEYIGGKTVNHRGEVTPAGRPVSFGWQDFKVDISWVVNFFTWDKDSDPRTQIDAYRKKSQNPFSFLRRRELDFTGFGMFPPDLPRNYFGTSAMGTFTIEPGEYDIVATTDDGMRVYLDDKIILDSWKYQGPTTYPIRVRLGGNHKIRVEHFQIDGYVACRLQIKLPPNGN